jgi:hypothetical protein
MNAILIDLALFAAWFVFAVALVWIGAEIEIRKKNQK